MTRNQQKLRDAFDGDKDSAGEYDDNANINGGHSPYKFSGGRGSS